MIRGAADLIKQPSPFNSLDRQIIKMRYEVIEIWKRAKQKRQALFLGDHITL